MQKRQLSIGELSMATGCNIETIRYYEKIDLLAAAERTSGNQRRYTKNHYKQLLFILHARELGFSIDAIRQLISLSLHPEKPCGRADDIARAQLENVRARIKRLKILEKELQRMAECSGGHNVHDCRVIEALADCGACRERHHQI